MHIDFADRNVFQSINHKVSKCQFDTLTVLWRIGGFRIGRKEPGNKTARNCRINRKIHCYDQADYEINCKIKLYPPWKRQENTASGKCWFRIQPSAAPICFPDRLPCSIWCNGRIMHSEVLKSLKYDRDFCSWEIFTPYIRITPQ